MSKDKPTKFFRTCKSCRYDNSDTATKCNSCAKSLKGTFSDNYHARWGCPDCGTINMQENGKCAGCDYKVPGCFLTSACVEYAGMTDDCEILTQMRWFRDEYVATLPNGYDLISEYYDVAPKIVKALNNLAELERKNIYAKMLTEVNVIVVEIKNNDFESARHNYSKMYADLVSVTSMK